MQILTADLLQLPRTAQELRQFINDVRDHVESDRDEFVRGVQGLRVLCDWLDAPSRYAKVKFECDVEADVPTGLDDIVVERTDGLQDLKQVKFTPKRTAVPAPIADAPATPTLMTPPA